MLQALTLLRLRFEWLKEFRGINSLRRANFCQISGEIYDAFNFKDPLIAKSRR